MPVLTQLTSLSLTSGLARLGSAHGWPKVAVPVSVAMVAMATVLLAWSVYRKNRLPFLKWPGESSQRNVPFRLLFAFEWAWLTGMILALGPNTQDRLLILVAFPASLFFSLIWSGQGSIRLIAGGIILFCAVTLPVSAMGYAFSHSWREVGTPGLLVLVGSTLVVTSALKTLSPGGSDSPRSERSGAA